MATTPSDVAVTSDWTLVLSGAGSVGTRGIVDALVVCSTTLPTTDAGAMDLMRLGGVSNSDAGTNVYVRMSDIGDTGIVPVWAV